jgi:hypothetical protein
MTKKRRRRDTTPRFVSTVPWPSPNGHSGGDASIAAAVRALLAEDEPEALPPTPAGPPRPGKTLTLTRPPGLTPAQATAQMTTRGLVHNALLIDAFSDP